MGETLRAFIAIPLPQRIIELAADLQSRLKSGGLKLRWVRLQGMHLTLKFLGDIPESQIDDLNSAMQRSGRGFGVINLAVQGLGVFPGIRRPRVLWIGIGGETERLGRLHGRLDAALEQMGIAREKRPFRAHLTLARAKGVANTRLVLDGMQRHGQYAARPFQARQLVLYQSDLTPRGAVYTARAEVDLA
jgi:2'-5' RNA ligase